MSVIKPCIIVLPTICRVCFKPCGDVLFDIFEENKYFCTEIYKVLKQCADVEINEDDKFAPHICLPCYTLLQNAWTFKTMCEASYKKWCFSLKYQQKSSNIKFKDIYKISKKIEDFDKIAEVFINDLSNSGQRKSAGICEDNYKNLAGSIIGSEEKSININLSRSTNRSEDKYIHIGIKDVGIKKKSANNNLGRSTDTSYDQYTNLGRSIRESEKSDPDINKGRSIDSGVEEMYPDRCTNESIEHFPNSDKTKTTELDTSTNGIVGELNIQLIPLQGNFICESCSKPFSSSKDLKSHYGTCPKTCNICWSTFKSSRDLIYHKINICSPKIISLHTNEDKQVGKVFLKHINSLDSVETHLNAYTHKNYLAQKTNNSNLFEKNNTDKTEDQKLCGENCKIELSSQKFILPNPKPQVNSKTDVECIFSGGITGGESSKVKLSSQELNLPVSTSQASSATTVERIVPPLYMYSTAVVGTPGGESSKIKLSSQELNLPVTTPQLNSTSDEECIYSGGTPGGESSKMKLSSQELNLPVTTSQASSATTVEECIVPPLYMYSTVVVGTPGGESSKIKLSAEELNLPLTTPQVNSTAVGECTSSSGTPINQSVKSYIKNASQTKYKSSACNQSYSRTDSLTYHTESHDQTVKHLCNVCNKTFSTSKKLYSHSAEHKNFECSHCHKKCHSKGGLELHINRCPKKEGPVIKRCTAKSVKPINAEGSSHEYFIISQPQVGLHDLMTVDNYKSTTNRVSGAQGILPYNNQIRNALPAQIQNVLQSTVLRRQNFYSSENYIATCMDGQVSTGNAAGIVTSTNYAVSNPGISDVTSHSNSFDVMIVDMQNDVNEQLKRNRISTIEMEAQGVLPGNKLKVNNTSAFLAENLNATLPNKVFKKPRLDISDNYKSTNMQCTYTDDSATISYNGETVMYQNAARLYHKGSNISLFTADLSDSTTAPNQPSNRNSLNKGQGSIPHINLVDDSRLLLTAPNLNYSLKANTVTNKEQYNRKKVAHTIKNLKFAQLKNKKFRTDVIEVDTSSPNVDASLQSNEVIIII